MTRQRSKLTVHLTLLIFALAFAVVACNNSSESKESTDTTTVKPDTTPMMDTMNKMMDTTNKMDTGKTKPVKEGN
jgi:hypothetical protein